MKASKTESDSDEERYLKVFYQETSKFIELPLDDDGKLSLVDIKAMDPNIYALNLTNTKSGRLCKPKNGYIKEPKEKWSSFKVIAVLEDSTKCSRAKSPVLNSTVESEDRAGQIKKEQLPHSEHNKKDNVSSSFSQSAPINATISTVKSDPDKLQFTLPTSSKVKAEQTKKKPKPSKNIKEALPDIRSSVKLTKKKTKPEHNEETVSPTSQTPAKLTKKRTRPCKRNKETVSPTSQTPVKRVKKTSTSSEESPPSTSVQPISVTNDTNPCVPADRNIASEVTNAELFKAYNVSSYFDLRKLLCGEQFEFYGTFVFAFNSLRKTMLTARNEEIVKILWYAYRSNDLFKILDPTALSICHLCDTDFTIKHLILKDHIVKYQSKYERDPVQIFKLLDSKNAAMLKQIVKSPEECFKEFKGCLESRISEVKLKLPFEKSFFIEKLWYFRHTFKHHPSLEDFFPASHFCENCNLMLEGMHRVIGHILCNKHLRKCLNQFELDKLYQAISIVNKSADGFGYSSFRNGNRSCQEMQIGALKRQKTCTFFV